MNQTHIYQFLIFFFLFIFFTLFQKPLTRLLKKTVCPICFATTSAWILLSIFYVFEIKIFNLDIETLFLSILMGGSVVGISSTLNQYLKQFSQKKALIKGIIIIGGFGLTYITVYYKNPAALFVMIGLWILGYFLQPTIKIKESLKHENMKSQEQKNMKTTKTKDTGKAEKTLEEYLKDCC